MSLKCSTGQFHFSEVTSYKIHTLMRYTESLKCFRNPQNVRRPLYQSEGKFLEEPQPPQARPQQSLFWDVTLPKMQPIVDLVITAYFFPTYLGGFIAFYSIFALLYTFVFMNIEFRSLRRPHKKIGATFHLDMMLLSNV